MVEIVVEECGYPGKFRARVGGETLCESRVPMLSSARLLLQLGFPPETELRMRHEGSDVVAMRSTIGAAARLTVQEDRSGPRFALWKPFPERAVEPPAAVSGSASGGQRGD